MKDTDRQQIKNSIHFRGMKGFYCDHSEKEAALQKAIDTAIKQEETRQALAPDNFSMNLPHATEEEKAQIELAIIEAMLRQKGATDSEIQTFMRTAEEIAGELIVEHKEHIANNFKVVK